MACLGDGVWGRGASQWHHEEGCSHSSPPAASPAQRELPRELLEENTFQLLTRSRSPLLAEVFEPSGC